MTTKRYVIDEVLPPPGGEGPFDYTFTYNESRDHTDELIIKVSNPTEMVSYPHTLTFRFKSKRPPRAAPY